jgi:uncharacterized membrane protein (DUF485 family)
MKIIIYIIYSIVMHIIITSFYCIIPLCCYFTIFYNNWNCENGINWYGYVFGVICFIPHFIVIALFSYYGQCEYRIKSIINYIKMNKNKECKICNNNKMFRLCDNNRIDSNDVVMIIVKKFIGYVFYIDRWRHLKIL